jgi:ATP-binding cassette, subfamily B, bacterial
MKPNSLKQAIQGLVGLKRAILLVWKSAPGWMLLNSVLVFVQGLLPLATLFLVRQIIDTITQGLEETDKSSVYQEVLLWLVLAAGVGILSAICRSLGEYASQAQARIVTDSVSDLLHAQSIAVDLGYYEDSTYYNTLHRAQAEAPYRPTSIVNGLVAFTQNTISLVGIVGLFLAFSPIVGVVMLAAAIPGAIVRLVYSRRLFNFEKEQAVQERHSWYYHWLMVSSDYAKEVRLFGLGELFKKRYHEVRKDLRQGRLAIARRRATADWIVQILATLAIFGTLSLAAYQAVNGKISVGDLMAIYMGFQVGLGSLQAILHSLAGLYEDQLFLTHFYQFLDLKPSVEVPANPATLPERLSSGIRFEHVSFTYPNHEQPALRDINLEILPGQVVALVGANGSGKTTLIKLLCRLYDPIGGQVRIDGQPLQRFDPSEWRKKISVIFQDYAHYQLSARENIWIGNVEQPPTLEPVIQAAQKSGADEVIRQLPQGYETPLGGWFEGGKELSGGEWQKIALGRAFMRETEAIVLDEPTSALDPLAEAELFRQFRLLIQGKSAILISHRFSTVKMADYIYVLDHGVIIEKGTHEELLEQNGTYARFFQAQAQYYL